MVTIVRECVWYKVLWCSSVSSCLPVLACICCFDREINISTRDCLDSFAVLYKMCMSLASHLRDTYYITSVLPLVRR